MEKEQIKENILKIKNTFFEYAKKFLQPKGFQEAEIETVAEEKAEAEKNKKMDAYIEFALIFILGILVGIAVKTEANKRITIGFDDYQMKLAKQDFNINNLQFEVAKKSAADAKSAQDQAQQQNNGNVPADANTSEN